MYAARRMRNCQAFAKWFAVIHWSHTSHILSIAISVTRSIWWCRNIKRYLFHYMFLFLFYSLVGILIRWKRKVFARSNQEDTKHNTHNIHIYTCTYWDKKKTGTSYTIHRPAHNHRRKRGYKQIFHRSLDGPLCRLVNQEWRPGKNGTLAVNLHSWPRGLRFEPNNDGRHTVWGGSQIELLSFVTANSSMLQPSATFTYLVFSSFKQQ